MPAPHTASPTAARAPGRALMVVTPARSAETDRRSAGFVTQLYACERRYGAYREARREEPGRAGAAYRGIAAVPRAALDVMV